MLKKAIAVLVIGFAIFYLLSAPQAAADAVRGAFGAIVNAFDQIITFINRLFA